LDSGTAEQKILYTHKNNRALFLAFVRGRDWLISSSTDKTIHVWDLKEQKTVRELMLNEPAQKFVLIGSDQLIFTNSKGNILLWDLNHIDRDPQVIYSNENRQPYHTLAYNEAHKWLVTTSYGKILVFPLNPDNTRNLKPEQFTITHKTVITQLRFSPDNNWLVSASSDAVMLWDIRDTGNQDIDKFVPVVIDNNHQILSVVFDEESRYLLFGDNRLLHIYPIDINLIYTKLKLKTRGKVLNDQEWKYYVKGDLQRPGAK
jgi:WD40 repeat protein